MSAALATFDHEHEAAMVKGVLACFPTELLVRPIDLASALRATARALEAAATRSITDQGAGT